MLGLSGFEQYSRWVPRIFCSLKENGCMYQRFFPDKFQGTLLKVAGFCERLRTTVNPPSPPL